MLSYFHGCKVTNFFALRFAKTTKQLSQITTIRLINV